MIWVLPEPWVEFRYPGLSEGTTATRRGFVCFCCWRDWWSKAKAFHHWSLAPFDAWHLFRRHVDMKVESRKLKPVTSGAWWAKSWIGILCSQPQGENISFRYFVSINYTFHSNLVVCFLFHYCRRQNPCNSWPLDHKIDKSLDLLAAKTMRHLNILCVNDRWPTSRMNPGSVSV